MLGKTTEQFVKKGLLSMVMRFCGITQIGTIALIIFSCRNNPVQDYLKMLITFLFVPHSLHLLKSKPSKAQNSLRILIGAVLSFNLIQVSSCATRLPVR